MPMDTKLILSLVNRIAVQKQSATIYSDDDVSQQDLQSQLFLLRIMSACMQHNWQFYRGAVIEATNNNNYHNHTPSTKHPQEENDGDWKPEHLARFELRDPPPLEDNLAKHLMNLMSKFMHQMIIVMERHCPQLAVDYASNAIRTEYYTNLEGPKSFSCLIVDIYKATSRVVFYLSASNWAIVFARIKSWLLYLSKVADENAETADIRLLECCALDQHRLGIVLQELGSAFLHLKRSAQLALGSILRRAIWNWIETYPSQFVALYQGKTRLEGNPEIFFDICNSTADTTRKKAILWPLQTLLLILSPDTLTSAVVDSYPTKKSVEGGRMLDVALICYVDICKVAPYIIQLDIPPLQLFLNDVVKVLEEKLLNTQKPLLPDPNLTTMGIAIDYGCLVADCLVAMFRLNPTKVVTDLYVRCIHANAPMLFKLGMVKSSLIIASEDNGMKGNVDKVVVYSSLSGVVRKLFLDHTLYDPGKWETSSQSSMSSSSGNAHRGKRTKKEYSPPNMDGRAELVLNLLRLFTIDPACAVRGSDEDRFEQNRALLHAVSLCLRDASAAIRELASTCLVKLNANDIIVDWGPPDRMMEAYWKDSSAVAFCIAKQMLDEREDQDDVKQLLHLLRQLLACRRSFLSLYRDLITPQAIEVKERLQASIGLEVAFLVLLCSTDLEICLAAMECFQSVCKEIRETEGFDIQQAPMTIAPNQSVYAELVSLTQGVTGRKSLQKRIRRALRRMSHCTPGNLAAWEEVWKRWKYMTPHVLRPKEEEELPETLKKSTSSITPWHERLKNSSSSSSSRHPLIRSDAEKNNDGAMQWLNYAGLLVSLGGICLMDNNAAAASCSSSSSSNTSTASRTKQQRTYGGDLHTHQRVSVSTGSAAIMDRCIMDMVDLLICDNAIIRDWMRDILGTDMSPALYHILFRHLQDMLSRCFAANNDPIGEHKCTLFVEQAISVTLLVLERIGDSGGSLLSVDISGLINQFANYLNKPDFSTCLAKIKIKMCRLCTVLMEYKDRVPIGKEFRLRNRLLETIVEWTSDFSLKIVPDDSGTNTKLQHELDMECLKTIVVLLHQLPLQPCDSGYQTDVLQIKSKMFYKYFTFFLKLLNRYRITESMSNPLEKKKMERELGPLKHYAILALSNLLSANIDVGLKYSFSMGYHEDPRTRTAFAQVMTNILNQGTEFETLADTVITDRYEKLVDILVEPDLEIMHSLCDACAVSDIDDMARVLLACFRSRQKTMTLIKAVIEMEVHKTESESDLFRSTSIATRLLSVFAKHHGEDYLRSVIQPVLRTLAEKPAEEKLFELDPSKLDDPDAIKRNKQNVINAAELFLSAICASADRAPKYFREICHCISDTVYAQFPEARYAAVGSFIFLRFFCPAIVSPEAEGLTNAGIAVTREMRRGFLIITKVIQNLANNVLFGAKETYMIMLNDFLTSNIYRVTSFLREMAAISNDTSETKLEEEPYGMCDKEYAMLHRVLVNTIDSMSQDFTKRRILGHDMDQCQGQFDKFANLVAQLGEPPELPKTDWDNGYEPCTPPAANQLYVEFMSRNRGRNVEPIVSKEIFYDGGQSKAGRPVLYFIMRHVIANSIDFELLIYYILQLIDKVGCKPFDLVCDVTQFGPDNEIPNKWINQLLQLMPPDNYQNFNTIFVYNPNSHLRKFILKLSHPVSRKVVKRTICVFALAELHLYIQPSDIRLPKSTVELDTENSIVFYPVNRLLQYREQIPVTVKVGVEHVQVMTTRKQDLFCGSTITNDVFHISDIEDISARGGDDEVVFKSAKDKLQVAFSLSRRDSMLQALERAKRRYELAQPTTLSERTIYPKDVPGRLLNMALLNIGSEDPNLRLASYQLLYSLSMTFNFDVSKQLLDTKDLCVPANSTKFIVDISAKLAETEPGLTLEFLSECLVGFGRSNWHLRYLCLCYMSPWLPNLALFCCESMEHLGKAKQVLRMLIDLTTTTTDMYRIIQTKVWDVMSEVDGVLDLVIETFIEASVEYGIGTPQAEALADTIVTLANATVRKKLVLRLRRILHRTSFSPTRCLSVHTAWVEVAVLVRFILMFSFNSHGPVRSCIPELFHIVSLVAGIGPTLVRASVHGIVVNVIQSLCTTMPLNEGDTKKLQLLLSELSGSKYRLLFGLSNPRADAFTINPETMTDDREPMQLASLEMVVSRLLEVVQYGSVSTDLANAWKTRWMSLVTSSVFQFNPAVQPRIFVVLGVLGDQEIDDDLLYQIMVALRGALAIYTENDSTLVVSILMCLRNIVRSLPSHSRYTLQLFWVGVALVELNSSAVFPMALEFLQSILRVLDANDFFVADTAADVLLAARENLGMEMLDATCGVNFRTDFSFAMACLLMKGLHFSETRELIYQTLTTFLTIESKHGLSPTLGYIAGLLPIAQKDVTLQDLVWAGAKGSFFDVYDVPDDTSALLLVSFLVAQLNLTESESDRLFLYELLSEAAMAIPETFALVYDSLLPKMNQIVINSQQQLLFESVKTILVTACANPVFNDTSRTGQKAILEELGFKALTDATFGAASTNTLHNAKLASEIIYKVIR
ncbi:Ras GTPase activating protein ira2 [Apophysomyces ossiformis]|uniref:Ras GTPase activating protein ira2 n=1 Tax=Apophysomyces ossiformis TaxID=679940 RepID=A0A8H7EMY0_9FUNG|nr:Ras GTPase activating protein ira2 [Apophysomyces ossiformis]